MLASSSSTTTWSFIVGNCAQWEEGRSNFGDKALNECLKQIGETDHVLDDDCTKANCIARLSYMLSRSQPFDTLIFYYGAHGTKKACMIGNEKWYYEEIIQLVESSFRGDKVWFLMDCCYSGCFTKYLPATSRKTYLSIMSTTEVDEADEDWIMSQCWIQAMRDQEPQRICDLISTMADQTAFCKNDRLHCHLMGAKIAPLEQFPFVLPVQEPESTKSSPSGVTGFFTLFVTSLLLGVPNHGPGFIKPRDHKVYDKNGLAWKQLTALKKGQVVYVKWKGGRPYASAPYISPIYLEATVQSDAAGCSQERIQVLMQDSNNTNQWKSHVSRDDMLPETYFQFNFKKYLKAHKILAKHGLHVDCSIEAGTNLWVFSEDLVLAATVMHDKDVPWHKINNKIVQRLECIGPCVFVQLIQSDKWKLIPTCRSRNLGDGQAPSQEELSATPLLHQPIGADQVLYNSMQSMSKHLVDAPSGPLICYWDGQWVEAKPAILSGQLPSMEVMMHHFHFRESGSYCVVRWNSGCLAMLPEKLIQIGVRLGSTSESTAVVKASGYLSAD